MKTTQRKHNVSLEYWLELCTKEYHNRGMLSLGDTMDYEYIWQYITRRKEGPKQKPATMKREHEVVYPEGHTPGD